jgi:hypothetical protein
MIYGEKNIAESTNSQNNSNQFVFINIKQMKHHGIIKDETKWIFNSFSSWFHPFFISS